METYTVLSAVNAEGKVSVKRVSDGVTALCKESWLKPSDTAGLFVAKSKTKAIRLDGLEWTTEG